MYKNLFREPIYKLEPNQTLFLSMATQNFDKIFLILIQIMAKNKNCCHFDNRFLNYKH